MLSSLSNLSWMQRAGSHQPALNLPTKQKTEPPPTGLQALVEDGPPRLDGSDKFFGMENVVGFGNTCYCNSILQCLYYSKPFRENVVNFPYRAQLPNQSNSSASSSSNGRHLSRTNTEPIPTISSPTGISRNNIPRATAATKGDLKKPGNLPVTANLTNNSMGPENKDTSEAKKKQALLTGPVLNIDHSNNAAYGMEENLFSGLKDIFETIMGHESRTGVVNPTKFLEILRRENDMFSGQQHQDAHEFLNYVLNQVIENVDDYQKKHGLKNGNGNLVAPPRSSGSLTPINASSAASTASMTSTSATGWIHELFEGLLSSETKCLTCENVSRRDEQFLDLSIDLEKNSSVTSCLRNFSASEMLCERNKFHCDTCGGLQEAEKRMKIKRLPKVLALHLKRFKFMEHLGRFEKLHYRVLYPYHLRLFNTTDDADDPDRLYELYAVVVHIGGGPYHGHYVAIVKTEDKGWLLFDDELVEPVDKAYVRNFFGERPGMACAYVLFYQETTLEAVQREQWAEEQQAEEAARAAAEAAKTDSAKAKSPQNGGIHVNGHANRGEPKESSLPPLHISSSEPPRSSISVEPNRKPATETEPTTPGTPGFIKSRKEKEKERREEKEREKAGKVEKGDTNNHGMNRFRNTSKSFRGPPKWLGGDNKGKKGKERNASLPHENGDTPPLPPLPPTPALPTSPVALSPVQPPVEEKKELNGTNGSLGKLEEPEKERVKELEKEQKENEGHSPVEHKEDAKETKETKEEKTHKKEKELEKLREKADKKKDKETKAKHRTSFFGLRKKASIALNAGGSD